MSNEQHRFWLDELRKSKQAGAAAAAAARCARPRSLPRQPRVLGLRVLMGGPSPAARMQPPQRRGQQAGAGSCGACFTASAEAAQAQGGRPGAGAGACPTRAGQPCRRVTPPACCTLLAGGGGTAAAGGHGGLQGRSRERACGRLHVALSRQQCSHMVVGCAAWRAPIARTLARAQRGVRRVPWPRRSTTFGRPTVCGAKASSHASKTTRFGERCLWRALVLHAAPAPAAWPRCTSPPVPRYHRGRSITFNRGLPSEAYEWVKWEASDNLQMVAQKIDLSKPGMVELLQ